ncbi:MAG: DUF4331 family protein [Acidobacteria bacterium]|nr:DUF4331 family protein [Acidobacteriota bacterium]
MTATRASSHREAPLISQDPLADNTDLYAFVSPERRDRVVLISNFIPLNEAPTPEVAAAIGDLLARTGDARGADEMYARAEALEREGWKLEEPQPGALARMLAERGLKIAEAVRLAERAARDRSDIVTMDTLAWAYFQAGRFAEARAASVQALRTGTADPRIRCHAAAIEAGSPPRTRARWGGGGVSSRGRCALGCFERAATSPASAVDRAQCRLEQRIPELETE